MTSLIVLIPCAREPDFAFAAKTVSLEAEAAASAFGRQTTCPPLCEQIGRCDGQHFPGYPFLAQHTLYSLGQQ